MERCLKRPYMAQLCQVSAAATTEKETRNRGKSYWELTFWLLLNSFECLSLEWKSVKTGWFVSLECINSTVCFAMSTTPRGSWVLPNPESVSSRRYYCSILLSLTSFKIFRTLLDLYEPVFNRFNQIHAQEWLLPVSYTRLLPPRVLLSAGSVTLTLILSRTRHHRLHSPVWWCTASVLSSNVHRLKSKQL